MIMITRYKIEIKHASSASAASSSESPIVITAEGWRAAVRWRCHLRLDSMFNPIPRKADRRLATHAHQHLVQDCGIKQVGIIGIPWVSLPMRQPDNLPDASAYCGKLALYGVAKLLLQFLDVLCSDHKRLMSTSRVHFAVCECKQLKPPLQIHRMRALGSWG